MSPQNLSTPFGQPARAMRLAMQALMLSFLALTLPLPAAAAAGQSETGSVQGSVSMVGPDGEPFNVPGVGLTLRPSASEEPPLAGFTDDTGTYIFADLAPAEYVLEATLQGFATRSVALDIRSGEVTTADVRLELAGVTEEVTVTARAVGIEVNEPAPAPEMEQETLQAVPLAKEQYQDALPLVPGVVRGPDGLLNVKGSRASQSGLTVNSANVTDPVTGEFALNLPIEAVQSVEVQTNPYSAEFGKFTGGVTSIETRSGGDHWTFQIQNFMPRIRRREGTISGIEAASPRVAVGGPIVKGRLAFMQSVQYIFNRSEVESLPALERDTERESFDSFSQIDWTIDASNHLTSSFSIFPQNLTYAQLDTFNPRPVTPNFRQRGFFWAGRERMIIGEALLESFVSVKQFDADVFPAQTGPAMTLAPDVNSGGFFNRQERNSSRVEMLETFSFTPAALGSAHFIRLGAGASRDSYDGSTQNQPVRIVRADGSLAERIAFGDPAALSRSKTEVLAYVQDTWQASSRITLDYGLRYDRDTIADAHNVAPRVAVAFIPVADGRTVIRGGAGVFYDKINLNVASFEQQPDRVVTLFDPAGRAVGAPLAQRLALASDRFRTPRSYSWNVELDREWLRNLLVGVGYQERRGRREYVIDPVEVGPGLGLIQLRNDGRSRYREFQVTGRYRFHDGDNVVASYTRSSAIGDLNDFNTFFGNFQDPVIRPNQRSRLPWDAPNRFVLWGTIHTKGGLEIAPVIDVRDGFPVSTVDEGRHFVGRRNRAGRFPTFFSTDLQVLKSVTIPFGGKRYRAKVGVRVFNLTNHFNPRDFQDNLAAAAFGGTFNGVGRQLRGKFVIDF